MCGIVGSINSKLDLNAAIAKIKHRGPDAQGAYENEYIQFGHVRLSIIDLTEGANQPFIDRKTGSVLVFNGEIYNFKEHKETFLKHVEFSTESDTEVLFHGLQFFGIDFVQKLRGMFAFAFYDGIKNKSYLVRDRFGIKPLYLKKEGHGYLFSSEIKAIRSTEFSADDINKDRLADFIYHRRLDHTNETFYNGIVQLPAGSYLSFDHANVISEIVQYYQVPCIGNGNSEFNPVDLKAKITDTVYIHLQADVPVGSFLSGGIDSSIISHVMTKLTNGSVSTLSGRTVYEHTENKLIDTFLDEHPNVKSIQFELDGSQFYEEIFNVIKHHDEPILDGSMFSHYMLCKKAHENGLKVVLSGSGGDEVFGGYESHSIGFMSDYLSKLKLRKFSKSFKKYVGFHQHNASWVASKIVLEFIGQKWKSILKSLKTPTLKVLTLKAENEFFSTKCKSYSGSAFERSLKYQTVPPYLHYEDRNSMAFGVEIRVPFLDHKLVEYVAELKQDEMFNGTTKSTLRRAFKNDISNDILFQRKKEGFPSPIDTALQVDERIKTFFYHNLSVTPFLNVNQCKVLADDFYSNGKNLTLYWRVLSYMMWYSLNCAESDQ
jgi:asparagine synthase (glutamine-hydrolysing)